MERKYFVSSVLIGNNVEISFPVEFSEKYPVNIF